jgi:hypothetical protein
MVMGATLVGALAPAALAQESNDSEAPADEARPRRPQLTEEQQACLEEQGIVKPEPNADGERPRPTDEQREAFRAAAEACGIELPARHGPRLTDEQKSCLEEQGIEKPARGEDGERVEPTDEQREAFRAAAEACGIDLPDNPPSDSNDDTSNAS